MLTQEWYMPLYTHLFFYMTTSLSWHIYTHIYVCNFRHTLWRNTIKGSIASTYCSALAHRMAAVDNDCKRWWLTQWKQGTSYCIELLTGLHWWQRHKYAMYLGIQRCTHHWTQVHFLRRLSLSQRWNFTPLPHVTKWVPCFMRMCALYTITQGFWVIVDLVVTFKIGIHHSPHTWNTIGSSIGYILYCMSALSLHVESTEFIEAILRKFISDKICTYNMCAFRI